MPHSKTNVNNFNKDDLVIVFMGPTGSGKSNMIAKLTEQAGIVGHELKSCTSNIKAFRIRGHVLYQDRLVLVDTPGFDDTVKSEMDILKMIAGWLAKSYKRSKVTPAGVIYTHQIIAKRMTASRLRNFKMFKELCGPSAAKNVVLVTTMWDSLSPTINGNAREQELKTNYWRDMIEDGASTARSYNTSETVWNIIDSMMSSYDRKSQTLLVQKELVQQNKHITQTHAAKVLAQAAFNDLNHLRAEIKNKSDLKQFNVPLMTRIVTFLKRVPQLENLQFRSTREY